MSEKKQADSVYIHIPFCKSKCIYCGFFSNRPANFDVRRLLAAQIEELKRAGFQRPPQTLYIGGGNPSSLQPELLCGFLREVAELTGMAEEFTVEINPADTGAKLLDQLKKTGVNRISIGIQSFNDKELKFLGRKYSPDAAAGTIESAKSAGFENISIDLIFAIPGSDISRWKKNLDRAISAEVEHISAYSLTYEAATTLEEYRSSGKITAVSQQRDRQMYETAIEKLTGAGFEHYEISNFAKPSFRCRHNRACWQNKHYLGIGPAAWSYLENLRTGNIADINEYIRRIEQGLSAAAEQITLSREDIAAETAVLGLRMTEGIDIARYKAETGYDILSLFAEAIQEHAGLLQIENNHLSLRPQALAIADSVVCDFAQIRS